MTEWITAVRALADRGSERASGSAGPLETIADHEDDASLEEEKLARVLEEL